MPLIPVLDKGEMLNLQDWSGAEIRRCWTLRHCGAAAFNSANITVTVWIHSGNCFLFSLSTVLNEDLYTENWCLLFLVQVFELNSSDDGQSLYYLDIILFDGSPYIIWIGDHLGILGIVGTSQGTVVGYLAVLEHEWNSSLLLSWGMKMKCVVSYKMQQGNVLLFHTQWMELTLEGFQEAFLLLDHCCLNLNKEFRFIFFLRPCFWLQM